MYTAAFRRASRSALRDPVCCLDLYREAGFCLYRLNYGVLDSCVLILCLPFFVKTFLFFFTREENAQNIHSFLSPFAPFLFFRVTHQSSRPTRCLSACRQKSSDEEAYSSRKARHDQTERALKRTRSRYNVLEFLRVLWGKKETQKERPFFGNLCIPPFLF